MMKRPAAALGAVATKHVKSRNAGTASSSSSAPHSASRVVSDRRPGDRAAPSDYNPMLAWYYEMLQLPGVDEAWMESLLLATYMSNNLLWDLHGCFREGEGG